MKVLFWNVRNLSNEIFRQGAKGRTVDIHTRIRTIEEHILTVKPDICFLLETGPDVKNLFNRFNLISAGYKLEASDVTGGETYTIIFNQNLQPPITHIELFADIEDRFRKPLLVKLKNDYVDLNFVVFHAPSPSHHLENVRFNAFKKILNELKKINGPIVFCGDLNIKRDELPAFFSIMQEEGYHHKGPFNEDGSAAADTSFRTFKTQIKTLNYESQPYDQVWVKPDFSVDVGVEQVNSHLVRVSSKVDTWLAEELDKYALFPNNVMSTRGGSDSTHIRPELKDRILYFLKTVKIFEKAYSSRDTQSILPILKEYWASLNKVYNYLVENKVIHKTTLPSGEEDTEIFGGQITSRVHHTVFNVLGKFNPVLFLAYRMMNIRTEGPEFLESIDLILTEFGISDHASVLITIP